MSTMLQSVPRSISEIVSGRGEPPMGEVRVQVLLTNAFDAVRLELGEISEDQVRQCEVDAMVDTGAVATVIPQPVADALGIAIRGKREARYADGRIDLVDVTHPVFIEVMGRGTAVDCLVLGDEVLIGQTVLEMSDLYVDCARCRLVPNPDHPDHAILKVKGFSR